MNFAGIELRNFRSIGEEPVALTPWRKCNILIGQNNAGKSNVIKAVEKISNQLRGGHPEGLEDLDLHRRSPENEFRFRLYFESNDPQEELARFARATSFYFDFSWRTKSNECG